MSVTGIQLTARWAPKPGYHVEDGNAEAGWAADAGQVWRDPVLSLVDLQQRPVGPHEVVIQSMVVALGENDVRLAKAGSDGYVCYKGPASLPRVLGQQFAGRVLETGSKVTNVKTDDYVTAEAFHYCGKCEACRIPYYNMCHDPQELGRTIDGALSEKTFVDSRFCWSINNLVQTFGTQKGCELGAAVLPMATVYHALFIVGGGFLPGESVVVYGSNILSLCAVALARSAGAGQILFMEEKNSTASVLARQLGATQAYCVDELESRDLKPHDAVLQATRGLGAAVHIETSGRADLFMEEIHQCLGMKGQVICAVNQGIRTPIHLDPFISRMGKVSATHGHAGYAMFPNIIELLGSGAADMTAAILGRIRLQDVPGAIEQMEKQPWGLWIITGTMDGEQKV